MCFRFSWVNTYVWHCWLLWKLCVWHVEVLPRSFLAFTASVYVPPRLNIGSSFFTCQVCFEHCLLIMFMKHFLLSWWVGTWSRMIILQEIKEMNIQ